MQHSPLLDLPGEIRNRIYDYVFSVGTYTFTRQITQTRFKTVIEYITSRLLATKTGNIPPEVALSHTCRQIYHESKLLPFTLNTFYFNSLMTFIEMRNYFATEQLCAIKKFHTMVQRYDIDPHSKEALEQARREGHTFSSLLPSVDYVTVDISERHYFDVVFNKSNWSLIKWLNEKGMVVLELRVGSDPSRAVKVQDFLAARSGKRV